MKEAQPWDGYHREEAEEEDAQRVRLEKLLGPLLTTADLKRVRRHRLSA